MEVVRGSQTDVHGICITYKVIAFIPSSIPLKAYVYKTAVCVETSYDVTCEKMMTRLRSSYSNKFMRAIKVHPLFCLYLRNG